VQEQDSIIITHEKLGVVCRHVQLLNNKQRIVKLAQKTESRFTNQWTKVTMWYTNSWI